MPGLRSRHDYSIGFTSPCGCSTTQRSIASGLSTDGPPRVKAKAVIAAENERPRWRIWNGQGGASLSCSSGSHPRAVMHAFKGERGHRTKGMSSRKLWSALHAADRYLPGQSSWLVNYAERHRAGLRVGTSITEGTANFLVNRRMNKAQQMQWTRRGTDLLLKVRCAVYNGTLGSGFGHRFDALANPNPIVAKPGMIPPISGQSRSERLAISTSTCERTAFTDARNSGPRYPQSARERDGEVQQDLHAD